MSTDLLEKVTKAVAEGRLSRAGVKAALDARVDILKRDDESAESALLKALTPRSGRFDITAAELFNLSQRMGRDSGFAQADH